MDYLENRLTLRDVALASVALVVFVFAASKLPNNAPDLHNLAAGVIHSPECDRYANELGVVLKRFNKEDRAAEQVGMTRRVELVSLGAGPDDPRVKQLYADEDAAKILREQRQQAEVDAIRAKSRAAGCVH